MASETPTSLAPGFRFHPTDQELVRYYLRRKVSGKTLRFDPIGVIDIYKTEPWDLPLKSKLKSRDLEWYFFSALDKKYGNSSRTNRATEKGYWKTTGKDRPIKHNSRTVGMKKTLVYHSGRAPRGTRTNWVMHEYKLVDEELGNTGIAQDAFVLCRVFQKSGSGPKNGEQYGAPFLEQEWEDDDEVAVPPVEEVETDMMALCDNDFVETKDLEQNLDTGMTSEGAGLPSNFYYGETSSCPNHSLELSKEYQNPQLGTVNDQFWTMPEHFTIDCKPVKDEITGEANHDENPLNFNYSLDELYLDATDVLSVTDASFLETNDLVNPTEAYTGGVDMVDEYLSFFGDDDDVAQYISFDSPQMPLSEDPVSEQTPLTKLNVDEGTNDASMASEQCGNEASSSEKKLEASKLVSESKNSFIKQAASHLLGNIPAPPAFAAEFPSKEIALRLQSAAQSSNSAAHVSAGLIRITNLTLSGNEMDWTLGKNGEINVMLSSQADAPAALVPVPGLLPCKTACMVSHGWFFLIFSSILILSLSFKIGSFMYTGK